MNTVFKLASSFFTAMYIFGILFNLSDVSYTEKAVRLTFTLFMVTYIFVPLKNMDFNFSIPEQEYAALADDYVIRKAAELMEKNIISELEEKNISYSDVIVHINKQNDGVTIDHIVFYGISQSDKAAVTRLFEDKGNIIFGD